MRKARITAYQKSTRHLTVREKKNLHLQPSVYTLKSSPPPRLELRVDLKSLFRKAVLNHASIKTT